jgi:hypothetical protein
MLRHGAVFVPNQSLRIQSLPLSIFQGLGADIVQVKVLKLRFLHGARNMADT